MYVRYDDYYYSVEFTRRTNGMAKWLCFVDSIIIFVLTCLSGISIFAMKMCQTFNVIIYVCNGEYRVHWNAHSYATLQIEKFHAIYVETKYKISNLGQFLWIEQTALLPVSITQYVYVNTKHWQFSLAFALFTVIMLWMYMYVYDTRTKLSMQRT